MKWYDDSPQPGHIPPRAALVLLIWFAFLVWCLVACAPVRASDPTLPEVHVTVYHHGLDWFQLEAFDNNGDYMQRAERICNDVQCVNETLARIGSEFTYSVTWKEIAQ